MMPSLLKYFTIVGGILFAGLIGLNALLDPGGPGPTLVKAEAPKRAIQLDPRASKVERLRAEEAAQKAAASATPIATAAVAAQPVPVQQPAAAPAPQPAPVTAAVQPAEPARTIAPAALTTGPNEAGAELAVRVAQEKMKAEKARKQRIARERAKARALEEASAQQVPQYRQVPPQYHYGYAPRPTYGPFGQGGGWGGGGWGQRW